MRKVLKTLALIAIGVAVGRVSYKFNNIQNRWNNMSESILIDSEGLKVKMSSKKLGVS